MFGAAPKASPCWTMRATGCACGMCSTWLIPAPGQTPATPGCGRWRTGTGFRWQPCWSGGMAPRPPICRSSLRMQLERLRTPTGPTMGRRSAASLQIPCWRSTMNSTEGSPSSGPSPPVPPLPSCPGAGTPPKTTLELRCSETFMSSTRRPPWPPWAPPSAKAVGRYCCRSRRWSGR